MKYFFIKIKEGMISGRFLKNFDFYEGISSITLSRAILRSAFDLYPDEDLRDKFYVDNLSIHRDKKPLLKIKDITKFIDIKTEKLDMKKLEECVVKVDEIDKFLSNVKNEDIKDCSIKEEIVKLINRPRKGREKNQLFTSRELHIIEGEHDNFGFIIGIKDDRDKIINAIRNLEFGFGGDKNESSLNIEIDTFDSHDLFEETSSYRMVIGEYIIDKGNKFIGRIRRYNAVIGKTGYSFLVARKGSIAILDKPDSIVGKNIDEEKQIFPGKSLSIKVDNIFNEVLK